MLAEDVKIDFTGFEPSQDVRSKLYFLLNQLHLKSPSQSLMQVTVTLTNGIFEGVVKITSSAENFVAKATDKTFNEMAPKLFDKALGQIDKWKKLRFEK